MAFTLPKTDWTVNSNAPSAADLNRIESNIYDLSILRDNNFSFEYDTDGDGVPDGWTWEPFEGGSVEMNNVSVDGQYCVKITSSIGSTFDVDTGIGGGKLLSNYIPINSFMSNYLIEYSAWGTADLVNYIYVYYYTSNKSYISREFIYYGINDPSNYLVWNSTTPLLFLSYFPNIPSNATFARIVIVGGVDSLYNYQKTGFFKVDAIKIYKNFIMTTPQTGVTNTFGPVSVTNGTESQEIPLTTARGYKLGYFPCTLSVTIEAKMNVVGPGGSIWLFCGSMGSTTPTFVNTTTYQTYTLSYTTSGDTYSPRIYYRTNGTDTITIRKIDNTNITITPTLRF